MRIFSKQCLKLKADLLEMCRRARCLRKAKNFRLARRKRAIDSQRYLDRKGIESHVRLNERRILLLHFTAGNYK